MIEGFSFSNLSFRYPNQNDQTWVFRDFEHQFEAGRSYALIGRSGCGKSTLLYLAAGVLLPSAGRVEDSNSGTRGLVTQKDSLFPWKTARENVELGLLSRFPKRERRQMALKALEDLGIGSLADRYPSQLSGGQIQRVSLARTLVLRPAILLMDEPTSQLDEMTREEVQNWIFALQQQTPRTLVFVTHSVEEAVFLDGLGAGTATDT